MFALSRLRPRGRLTIPAAIRRQAGFEPGDTLTFRVTREGVVEVRALPRMTLAEARARFRIEDPIDEPGDREAWQDEAARDVIGE